MFARNACQTRGLVDEGVPRRAVARVAVVGEHVQVRVCGTLRSRLPSDADESRLTHDILVAVPGSVVKIAFIIAQKEIM